MYTTEDFIRDIAFEYGIVKHLFTKIPEGQWGYKPTLGQRTTLELLQYMSTAGASLVDFVLHDGDMAVFAKYTEAGKVLTPETFLSAIDTQVASIQEMFSSFTEAELNTEISVFGMPAMPKRNLLMQLVFKTLVQYKMQLFLYIKASGNTSIGTSNLMAGMDAVPAK